MTTRVIPHMTWKKPLKRVQTVRARVSGREVVLTHLCQRLIASSGSLGRHPCRREVLAFGYVPGIYTIAHNEQIGNEFVGLKE